MARFLCKCKYPSGNLITLKGFNLYAGAGAMVRGYAKIDWEQNISKDSNSAKSTRYFKLKVGEG
jgi:hypothetical protein